MTDMKFQISLSFASVYMKKSYWDGQKILVCNPLVKLCWFILKTNTAEKRSMEKQLLTGILNTLLPVDSSATSITYKLVMLLIKRRNFLVKKSK